MDEQILKAFKTLPSSTERLAVTAQIVECLTSKEMLDLRDIVNQRNDPLTRLPIEIVTWIFSYLDMFDAWRLQAVCRQWRLILESKDLQSLILSGWDTHDTRNDEASDSRIGTAKSVESKLKHVRAFRLGAPVTALTFEANLDSEAGYRHSGLPRVALNGRRLAWIQHEREVAVRDLLTGSVQVLRGQAREKLTCLVLTDSHVAFVGFNGQLYVFNLGHLDQPYAYRLPSSQIQCITGDADIFAICFAITEEGVNGTEAVFTVAYCKADQHQLRMVTIGPVLADYAITAQGTSVDALLLSKERETLDVFGIMRRFEDYYWVTEHLMHFRVSLSEQKSSSHMRNRFEGSNWDSNPTLDCIGNGDMLLTRRDIPTNFTINALLPTGYKDLHQIIYWTHDEQPDFLTSIVFDARTCQIRMEYQWPELDALIPTSESRGANECCRWKDMLFFENAEQRLIASRMTGPHACGSTSPAGLDPLGRHLDFKAQNMLAHCGGYEYKIHVNDTFLVVVEAREGSANDLVRVTVFCFDEDIKMPGAKEIGFWKKGKFMGGPFCTNEEPQYWAFHHKCLDVDD